MLGWELRELGDKEECFHKVHTDIEYWTFGLPSAH